ncbi:hypothetical protein RUND412_007863 [Rhizina undulata]
MAAAPSASRGPIPFGEFLGCEQLFGIRAGPSKRCFYVHKALLAETSKEIRAHVYNDMRDGKEGLMDLENPAQMLVAMKSAETKSSDSTPNVYATEADIAQAKCDESLLKHAWFREIGNLTSDIHKKSVIALMSYCFGNLPTRANPDKLLEWLGKYGALAIAKLRKFPEFFHLLEDEFEFVKVLVPFVGPGRTMNLLPSLGLTGIWQHSSNVDIIRNYCNRCKIYFAPQSLCSFCPQCRTYATSSTRPLVVINADEDPDNYEGEAVRYYKVGFDKVYAVKVRAPHRSSFITRNTNTIPANSSTCPAPVAFEKFVNSSSELFCIRAGASQTCFYFHKELVAQISQELHAHVYNVMKEGKRRVMDLNDVSEGTIARFCQWAYTGDYYDVFSHITEPVKTGKTTPSYKPPSSTIEKASPVEPQTESEESPLIHARVYVFADKFNIPGLKNVSFNKLKAMLKKFGQLKDDMQRKLIIQLIAYSFGNLPARAKRDKLLVWLGKYAAIMIAKLRRFPEFFDIVEDENEFVAAMFAYVNPGKAIELLPNLGLPGE